MHSLKVRFPRSEPEQIDCMFMVYVYGLIWNLKPGVLAPLSKHLFIFIEIFTFEGHMNQSSNRFFFLCIVCDFPYCGFFHYGSL